MRHVTAALVLACALTGATGALAETRTFIVANEADGYGVDRCLATGASCGTVVATAYCRAQDFAQARSFRKVEPGEIAGSVAGPPVAACTGSCGDFVAIECTR